MEEKKPWSERLIESGERMKAQGESVEKGGKAVGRVGCAITQLVWGVLALIIITSCLWSVLFR